MVAYPKHHQVNCIIEYSNAYFDFNFTIRLCIVICALYTVQYTAVYYMDCSPYSEFLLKIRFIKISIRKNSGIEQVVLKLKISKRRVFLHDSLSLAESTKECLKSSYSQCSLNTFISLISYRIQLLRNIQSITTFECNRYYLSGSINF